MGVTEIWQEEDGLVVKSINYVSLKCPWFKSQPLQEVSGYYLMAEPHIVGFKITLFTRSLFNHCYQVMQYSTFEVRNPKNIY